MDNDRAPIPTFVDVAVTILPSTKDESVFFRGSQSVCVMMPWSIVRDYPRPLSKLANSGKIFNMADRADAYCFHTLGKAYPPIHPSLLLLFAGLLLVAKIICGKIIT